MSGLSVRFVKLNKLWKKWPYIKSGFNILNKQGHRKCPFENTTVLIYFKIYVCKTHTLSLMQFWK